MPRPWSEIRASHGWTAATDAARIQGELVAAAIESPVLPPQAEVILRRGNMQAIVSLATDAVGIGTPNDMVRPNVSMRAAQSIADAMGSHLPTPSVLDAAAAQAAVPVDFFGSTLPATRYDGKTGRDLQRPITSALGAMEEESDRVGALMVPGLLPTTVGKEWVISDRLLVPDALKLGKSTAINYGGHTRAGGQYQPADPQMADGLLVAQPPGAAHSTEHTDYSQRLRLMGPMAWVSGGPFGDGRVMTIDQLSVHPIGAVLLRPSGKPMELRHPWLNHPPDEPGGGGGTGGGKPPGAEGERLPVAPLVIAAAIAAALTGAGAWRWSRGSR